MNASTIWLSIVAVAIIAAVLVMRFMKKLPQSVVNFMIFILLIIAAIISLLFLFKKMGDGDRW